MMNRCHKKVSSKFFKSVLYQNNPLNNLNDIQNYFIVTSIDKANGNVAFLCQRFCTFVLIKQMVADHNNTGTTEAYNSVHKPIIKLSLATILF